MQRKLLLFVFTILLAAANSVCINVNTLSLGDINNDAEINASDASAVLEHSASIDAGIGCDLWLSKF